MYKNTAHYYKPMVFLFLTFFLPLLFLIFSTLLPPPLSPLLLFCVSPLVFFSPLSGPPLIQVLMVFYFLLHLYFYLVCVPELACHSVSLWWSKHFMQKLILSSHCVGSRN